MVHRKWGRADGEGSAVLARSPELFFLKKKRDEMPVLKILNEQIVSLKKRRKKGKRKLNPHTLCIYADTVYAVISRALNAERMHALTFFFYPRHNRKQMTATTCTCSSTISSSLFTPRNNQRPSVSSNRR